MKKTILLASMVASLLFVGCKPEEEFIPDEPGDVTTGYMAVNIVSSDASRVAEGFEDGSDAENKVNKVRFYFFNGTGGAVNVKNLNGQQVNYYDWSPGSGEQSGGSNPNDDIESKLTATIVINTQKGDGIPVRMAAVINPTDDLLDGGSKSLTDLKSLHNDYAQTELTTEGKFVMFNSVYVDGGKDFSTTDIKDVNICKSEEDAKKSPVKIYVERSVAKVSVALGGEAAAAGSGKLPLKVSGDANENLMVGGKQVYLKLLGWDLAAETSKGRLVKKINPGWEGNWWHAQSTYRTFWGINYLAATNVYDKTYNNITTTFDGSTYLYTNENAQTNDIDNTPGQAKNKTKVIITGQLVDEADNELTIVRHMGARFIDNPDNFENLKVSILNALKGKGYYYYCGDGNSKKQIDVADIEIVVDKLNDFEGGGNCYVYTQLTEASKKKTWYKSDAEDAAPIGADEINGTLKDKVSGSDKEYIIDRPLVWKDGMTYYYFAIKHLAESRSEGVVRNHIYKTTVSKIAGLGTPVYNPDEIIYPEKPENNDHYVAAEIDILSWRVVTTDYELEW